MEIRSIKNKPAIQLDSRSAWRQWLMANHASTTEIWLVYFKKQSGKQTYTKADAAEEALCFGWIDSLVQGIDDQRYMQKFSPRKPESSWSRLNKDRVAELERRGLMTPVGRKLIAAAKASGEWDRDRTRREVSELPVNLKLALDCSPEVRELWDSQPPSHRRLYLQWITSAKREETRLRRTEKAIKMLISGQSPTIL